MAPEFGFPGSVLECLGVKEWAKERKENLKDKIRSYKKKARHKHASIVQ